MKSDSFRPLKFRNPLALLCLLLFVLAVQDRAFAQFLPAATDVRIAHMGYASSDGELGLTVFHYDRHGVMIASTWMLDDQSRRSANGYVYDDSGRMVKKYREFSDGLTSTDTYEYNEAGLLSKETFLRSDGVGGHAEYRWNEEGLPVSAECDNYKGWFTGHISYAYGEGRLVNAQISRDGDSIGTIDYTYDPAGHLVSEVWNFNTGWSQTFTYFYEPVRGMQN